MNRSRHNEKIPLLIAARNGILPLVQMLVLNGADIEKADGAGQFPLFKASLYGHIETVRFLLEQGADRDRVRPVDNMTPLHMAACNGHLETAKLLMIYGADLNARNKHGQLPIDCARTEEIKQAIRDEPRRRMDEAPGKRATEQDRHPLNAATSTSSQQEDEEEEEPSNKKPRLDKGEEGKVAEEDEDSEPSDGEDDN